MDLGIVAEAEGHSPAEAISLHQQSSQPYEELGQKDRAAIARIRLGVSLYRSGRIDEAERTLEDSLTMMRSLGRLNQVREVLGDLARVELARNPARAEEIAQEQLDLNRKMSAADACCRASLALVAEALLAQGKLAQAKESIVRAFPKDIASLSLEVLPDMLLARGDIEMGDKDYAAAEADFENALKMARNRGAKYMELQARLGLAEMSVLRREESGRAALDRLGRDADRLGFAIFDVKIDTFLHTHHPAAWT